MRNPSLLVLLLLAGCERSVDPEELPRLGGPAEAPAAAERSEAPAEVRDGDARDGDARDGDARDGDARDGDAAGGARAAQARRRLPAPPDVAEPPPTAERTESGLASRVLAPGTGDARPAATDGVTVHYTGWRAEDGEMFDSSVVRGQPASFPLNRVIAGWTEGLQLMVEGEKRRFWIPAELAYEGRPGPQGTLVFDVELLSINRPPPTPQDVSAPPPSAERTDSGLASRRLEAGDGERHPAPTDRVTVHYAGWRAEDGELFDSSYGRGQPATFPLNGVIAGWTEGLQLMVEGEKRRFWIPAELAYEGRPGPQGMLVFDVELLEIL